MRKQSRKLDLLMFLHNTFGLSRQYVCDKAGISKATFYRYKKQKSN